MEIKDKVENEVQEPQQEETTQKRAMKIRLKTGIMAGRIMAVHL